MFKINDVVFFEDFGLCHILDIEERTFNNELKLYYVLKPISDCASLSTNISVSVDTPRILRKVASKDEVHDIIDRLPDIDQDWIASYRKREQFYKEKIDSGELYSFALVINYIYKEKIRYLEEKRPFPSKDQQYLNKAEMYFNQEIGYIMNIPEKDVEKYVKEILDIKDEIN
ncbi:MAG: CarD family transcriptional regulator [Erysipelotrichaceae bacterium]|nr:CarD family transcriptional regulator [Erysipelotrichaceae bacterium]